MYLDIVAIGIIIGWLRGGKLRNLGNLPIRGIWAIILLGLLETVIKFTQTADRQIVYKTLIMSFYGIAFYLLWINHRVPGVKLALTGLVLNFVVMAANGGRMPVSEWAVKVAGLHQYLPELYADTASRHFLLNDNTALKFLADIIPLPPPYPLSKVLSIGDAVLFTGLIMIVITGMLLGGCLKKDTKGILGGDEIQS